MTFEEFKANVEQWSKERGIYEHSTALAQALKAVSEVGELADAVIKDDKGAIKDAIGDVMVCLVNACKLSYLDIEIIPSSISYHAPSSQHLVAHISDEVAGIASIVATEEHPSLLIDSVCDSIAMLDSLSNSYDLTLIDCCEAAWLEIMDRKGKMVAGGAFVKDE